MDVRMALADLALIQQLGSYQDMHGTRRIVVNAAREHLELAIAAFEKGDAPASTSHLPKPVCQRAYSHGKGIKISYCSLLAGHEGECSWDR
jgi:hypothetical protein